MTLKPATPKKHQDPVLAAVVKGFTVNDRGQIIEACGSGKTLEGMWAAERLRVGRREGARRLLVVVPRLELIAQTLAVYQRNAKHGIRFLCVCSKKDVVPAGELGLSVTSDPAAIREFLNQKPGRQMLVVFSTYQSLHVVVEAQRKGCPAFDLAIADEAHWCVGDRRRPFSVFLNGRKIRAAKRLFMTATQKKVTPGCKRQSRGDGTPVASMDDPRHFGPVFHRLTFGEAIKEKILCDYKLRVIKVTRPDLLAVASRNDRVKVEEEIEAEAKWVAASVALSKDARECGIRRVIVFHDSVAKARRFADPAETDSFQSVVARLPETSRPALPVWVRAIDGSTPGEERRKILAEFEAGGACMVLSVCGCLGEGWDAPALDAVVFMDPKTSVIAIAQAAGRALRKADGKTHGLLLVPLFVGEEGDPAATVRGSEYEPLWNTILALAEQDGRVEQWLDELRKHSKGGEGEGERPEPPDPIDLPKFQLAEFDRAFYSRLVERATSPTRLTVEMILAWADAYKARWGRWPTAASGAIPESPGDTWANIDGALRQGGRNLAGGSSIPDLLKTYRGAEGVGPRRFTIPQILSLCDEHRAATGEYPRAFSCRVISRPDLDWRSINMWLRTYGGDCRSLVQLLIRHRGVESSRYRPDIDHAQIVRWAEEHLEITGALPSQSSGRVLTADNESWGSIDVAASQGRRSLPKGWSLSKILRHYLGRRKGSHRPDLDREQIKAWAARERNALGRWPTSADGAVYRVEGESWKAIDMALRQGLRNLTPGGSSLSKLLAPLKEAERKAQSPNPKGKAA